MVNKKLWITFILVLFFDQLTKYFALSYLSEGNPIPIIPDFFNFTLVYNPGAAFGMFSQLSDTLRHTLLSVVSVLALIVVLRFMLIEAKHDIYSQIALSGILAGALGNIIDRIRFDAVVDFLDFYVGKYHWPAFNIADSAISIGVSVLLVRMLFFGKVSEKAPHLADKESSSA